MNARGTSILLLVLATFPSISRAQAPAPADKEPMLRLEADGPTSFVTALAFDPAGETLYAAGYDKVVRVWTHDNVTKKFVLDRAATYRVPIGPELQGAINALTVSPDGKWLAAAGSGVVRQSAGFGVAGMIFPGRPRDPAMLLDEGRIYVYNTTTRRLTVLRGHKGQVLSMVFAPPLKDKPPLLISTAIEFDRKSVEGEGAVRIWNIETGKEYVAAAKNQPNRNTRVGLAPWYTDTMSAELRVAYAWGDGIFRVWDVDGGKLHNTEPDGLDGKKVDPSGKLNHNNTVVRWEQQQTFLTGSLGEKGGMLTGILGEKGSQLRKWTVRVGSGPKPGDQPLRLFPLREDGRDRPRALALLSSQANGQTDFAATVLRTDPVKGVESYSLRLIGLVGADAGEEKANIPLWNGGASLPALATVPNGKFLAVAGNNEHVIRVYRIADILKEKVPQWQSLRSVGEEFPSASFVRRGKDKLGIVLRQKADGRLTTIPREPVPGDLVFDFTSRSLRTCTIASNILVPSPDLWSTVLAGIAFGETHWRADGPEPSKADVKWAADKKKFVLTVRSGAESASITMGEKQIVTACALMAPGRAPAMVKDPLLAVAFTEDGLPRLYLYNGRTCEQIRHYSGHTDPIRSLAFSGDGKLLVSAAEDQTVCVWSLTNLDRIVGKHGRLPGVAVKEGKGGVEVFDITDDSPAKGKLAEGDVIEKLVDEKPRAKDVVSPGAFYDAVFMMIPGETVTLQRAGKPAVALKVSQGIDERKPLFSLFVMRGKVQPWEWVGWNPAGFYESSSADAENFIGWQINNADTPEKASSFAPSPEYRKRFYREGILRHLANRGDLSAALKDWDAGDMAKANPSPKLLLYLREANPIPDDRGEIVLKQAPATLIVNVDDLETDKIDWVRYQVEGEAGGLKELTPAADSDRAWTDDLKRLFDKPGLYRVRARVRTKETEPREWEKELLFRCGQDAPDEDRSTLPTIVLHKPVSGLAIYENGTGPPELEVTGRLTHPDNPRDCKAILLRNGEPVGDPQTLDAKATSFSSRFKPVPGLNRLEVRFTSDKGVSVTSEALQVSYFRPPRNVQFENQAELEKKPSEIALVNFTALVHSILPVKKESVRARVNRREFGTDSVDVEKVNAETWRIKLNSVPLEEGTNEIRVWAGNDEGESREPGLLKLVCKPAKAVAPPVVEIIDPGKDAVVTSGELALRARITSAIELKSISLVREGNVPLAVPVAVADLKPDTRGVFEVKVALQLAAGGNRLRLEAVNDGGKGEDALVITYLKKPVRLEIEYLTPRGKAGKENRIEPTPAPNGNGKLSFKGVPQDECVVHGWVLWDQEKDAQLRGDRAVLLRAYVNGKRQRPARLDDAAPGERRRAFAVSVVLTESNDNVIEIELPDLAQEASNPSEFHADCAKPNLKQYGHLLIIGTGKSSETALIQNALRAIQGKELPEEVKGMREFKAPSFEHGRIYPVLAGPNITPDNVVSHLIHIRSQIDKRAGEGSANDVLLVYYEGNEAVTADGHFLRTDRSRYEDDLKTSALTLDRLESYCSNTMGAQVLLLDVARDDSIRAAAFVEDKDAVIKRPSRSHVSVFRYLSLLDHLDAPSNPLLLASWEEATKKHGRLGEVGEEVGKQLKTPQAVPKSSVALPVGIIVPGG